MEQHKANFNLDDVILGGQDGIVNVLGVILGVAAASSDSRLVLVAGLAATFAESISMAAVAYTSKVAKADFYESELQRENREIDTVPIVEKEEIREIYKKRGFSGQLLEDVTNKIVSNRKVWLEVMMREELNLEQVNRGKILKASVLVGLSAVIGSFIPLFPFIFFGIKTSVIVGISISAVTLLVFGAYKAKQTVGHPLKSGIQLAVIGIVSALAGYLVGVMFKV